MRKLFLKSGDQRGVAAVEFAIVLPILLLLFAGITEFGIAYYNKQVLTNASREGARAGIDADLTESEIEDIVFKYILGNHDPDGKKNRLITFGTNDYNSNYRNYISAPINGYRVVTVEFEYEFLIFKPIIELFNIFNVDSFSNTIDIETSTTMKIIK